MKMTAAMMIAARVAFGIKANIGVMNSRANTTRIPKHINMYIKTSLLKTFISLHYRYKRCPSAFSSHSH